MVKLVLASTSPWRGELLARLGLPFDQLDPEFDEAPHQAAGHAPDVLVRLLAEAKARALAAGNPGALILGADQVASIDGRILGKPGTKERALAQLQALRGRTHELFTGTALLDTRSGALESRVTVQRMTMRDLTDAELRAYIDRDDPLRCAGSYKVESLGVALFERMDGPDWTSIIGLPLTVVTTLLRGAGAGPLGQGRQDA